MPDDNVSFSAAEQALGYFYQPRYALLQLLRMSEDTRCFIERDDDIDFTDAEEGRILASLKHKAPGDALPDLANALPSTGCISCVRFLFSFHNRGSYGWFIFGGVFAKHREGCKHSTVGN